MTRFRSFLAFGLLAPVLAFAGGGPFNVLVVVNTNSADSVELGNYYAAAHGIPAHHVCRLGIATNLATLTTNEFYALVRNPVTNHIATNGLSGQIDYLVLCMHVPTRVRDVEGVDACLFYGFKNAPSYWEAGSCNLPANTSNEYFRAERAFRSADGQNDTNGFVAFHLVASNLPAAKLVVDRGVAAQSSFPSSAMQLYMVGYIGRYVREVLFANAQFSFTALPGLAPACVLGPYRQNMTGQTNVVGYQDGYANIPGAVATGNVWLAGAYADHLTSYGGRITANLTNDSSQSTVLDWMGIGATASYGTVTEPCAYTEKFPDPLMAFFYARGFTIGEAYFMAVEAPYHGLFAGDPLAAPFAAPPETTVLSHVPYQIVTGTVPVQVSVAARSNGVPAAQLDLYLDERYFTNLATLGPTRNNKLSVVVGARTNTATVTAVDDTLFEAVAALADAVNSDGGAVVSARALGDRLELIYENFDFAGDHLPVSASVATGTASALTLGVGLAATNLHPSVYRARKQLLLYAHTNGLYSPYANAGDTVTCTLTLTNGVAVTNVVVATANETMPAILDRLMAAINSNATLMATNGVVYDRLVQAGHVLNQGTLFARTPGPGGASNQVHYVVAPVVTNYGLRTNFNFSGFLDDNPDDVRPRANALFHVRPTNDVLAATASVDTTALADGEHVLDFIARDGSAVAAQSRLTLPLLVCNSSPQLSVLGTNGAAVADGETPSSAKGTDFGRIAWNQPRTNVLAIHNNGTAALHVANWTTNGTGAAAFQISGVPAVVEAGGVSNFLVVFAPPAAGAYAAALAFASDALVPQTNVLFAGTHGLYSFSVASAHGVAAPLPGAYTNAHGAVLTNSVAAPAPAGGTQYVCLGWTLAGHDPADGAATNFEMTVTNDAALLWLWTTNYWLDTEAGAHGSVNVADAWQPAGATTQITATADAYYHFTNWTGSVSSTNNPLELLLDAPKAIQANFAETLAASNVPHWWLAQYGWTNDFDAVATNDAEPDGFFTWQEFVADTDPTNAAAYPQMTFIETWQTNAPILTWPASTGRLYAIHWCDDLVVGEWAPLPLGLGSNTWTDTNPPPATGRYYRISPQLP